MKRLALHPSPWIGALLLAVHMAMPANAQTAGEITFTATATVGQEGMRPELTWSTNPAANDCQASGGWTGSKGAGGTEVLAPITVSTTYVLTCFWQDNTATLSWSAPTTLVNGQPLTDLAGFNLYYGTNPANLSNVLLLNDPAARSTAIFDLAVGTWHFAMTARRTAGNTESARTNTVSKVIGAAASAMRDIAITISPAPPNPPTNLQAQ